MEKNNPGKTFFYRDYLAVFLAVELQRHHAGTKNWMQLFTEICLALNCHQGNAQAFFQGLNFIKFVVFKGSGLEIMAGKRQNRDAEFRLKLFDLFYIGFF